MSSAHDSPPAAAQGPGSAGGVGEFNESTEYDNATWFGRYRLVKRLAKGGMGEIHLAVQTGVAGFERPVVLKTLSDKDASPEVMGMLVEEARLVARLSHQNIVTILDVGESKGGLFLVFEYLDGVDVARVLDAMLGRTIPVDVVVALLVEACAGLAYAHAAKNEDNQPLNVVHRDITPGNLFIASTGALKIIDFGIARYAGRLTKTATHLVRGKPSYMAPEQVRGETLDGQADQYSLALVGYELLAGLHPFRRTNSLDSMKSVLQEDAPPLIRFRKDVPPTLAAAIARAMSKERADRFPDCAAFSAALRPLPLKPHAVLLAEAAHNALRNLEQPTWEAMTLPARISTFPDTLVSRNAGVPAQSAGEPPRAPASVSGILPVLSPAPLNDVFFDGPSTAPSRPSPPAPRPQPPPMPIPMPTPEISAASVKSDTGTEFGSSVFTGLRTKKIDDGLRGEHWRVPLLAFAVLTSFAIVFGIVWWIRFG